MTKNNLRQHLSWLLNRGLPDFSSVDTLARPDPNLVVSNPSAPTVQQPNRPVPQEPLNEINPVNNIQDGQPQVKPTRDEDFPTDDPEMARLHLVPSSETKPRLLSSSSRKNRSITPTTPTTRKAYRSSSPQFDDQKRNAVKGLSLGNI